MISILKFFASAISTILSSKDQNGGIHIQLETKEILVDFCQFMKNYKFKILPIITAKILK